MNGDTITFTGTATSEDEKAAVEAAARAAWPDLKVSNDIQVMAPTGAPGTPVRVPTPVPTGACANLQAEIKWPATDADQLRHRRVHADGRYGADVDSGRRQVEGLPGLSGGGQRI